MASKADAFDVGDYVVYPKHGVGRVIELQSEEIAGMQLDLYVLRFEKERMTLRVPVNKVESIGMRKLSSDKTLKEAMETLKGKPKVKRTMWSRRAQEYEAKINSGEIVLIAEVTRDLFRPDDQPEQSYSERQLYEAALERLDRELSILLGRRLPVEYDTGRELEVTPFDSNRHDGTVPSFVSLAATELDDQLLLDRIVDLLSDRHADDLDGPGLLVNLDPGRRVASLGLFEICFDQVARLVASRLDDIARLDQITRHVALTTIDREVTVTDDLASEGPRGSVTRPEHDVVQTSLEKHQQGLARIALRLVRHGEETTELLLEHPVEPFDLLLLAQLQRVFGLLGTEPPLLTGRSVLPGIGALTAPAKSISFTSAEPTLGTCIPGHLLSVPLSDPALLARPATIVGQWCHILDRLDVDPG